MDRTEPPCSRPGRRPLVRLSPPVVPKSLDDIIQTVEAWSFQPETCDVDLGVVAEDSVLSMARRSPRPSFVAIRNGYVRDLESESQTESEPLGPPIPVRQPTILCYEGASYRLEIRK